MTKEHGDFRPPCLLDLLLFNTYQASEAIGTPVPCAVQLHVPHFCVFTIKSQQFIVGALLGDLSISEYNDVVRIFDCQHCE